MGDVRVVGDRVRLRDVGVGDARLLELWQGPGHTGEFNDFGLPRRSLGRVLREGGLSGQEYGTLMVEVVADGSPIGTVSWRAVRYGPNQQSIAWNIGINLVPEGRGQGFGAEAQRLLAEHLLATTAVRRIEAMTDVENVAEQRSLERAGFQREGVLRRAQYRAGDWHDLVVYSVVSSVDPGSAGR